MLEWLGTMQYKRKANFDLGSVYSEAIDILNGVDLSKRGARHFMLVHKDLTYRMICYDNHTSRRIGENRRRRTIGSSRRP
jgi:hypothetical protein